LSEPYELNVKNNDFVFSAGDNATAEDCSRSYTLHGTMPEGAKGTWSGSNVTFDNANNSNATVSGLSNSVDGNTLRWTVTYNGCEKHKDVVIYSNDVDEPVIYTKSQSVCKSSVSLNANTPVIGNGHWEYEPATITINEGKTSTDAEITVSNLPENSNATFVWVIEKKADNGNVLCSKRSDVVTLSNRSYSAVIKSSDKVVCQDYATDIVSEDVVNKYNAKGWWTADNSQVTFSSTDANAISSSSFKVNVYNLPNGTPVTLTWHVQGGDCPEKTNTVKVTNEQVTVAENKEIYICNTEANLEAELPDAGWKAQGKWSCTQGNNISGLTYDNQTNYETTVSGIGAGDYTFSWTLESPSRKNDPDHKKGCAATQEIIVHPVGFTVYADNSFDKITVDVLSGKKTHEVCGAKGSITAKTPYSEGSGYWTRPSTVTYTSESTSNVLKYDLGTQTRATFVWHDNNGHCTPSDEITIVNIAPVVDKPEPFYTCDGEVTLIATDPAPNTGVWSKSESLQRGNFSGVLNQSTATYVFADVTEDATTATVKWTVTSQDGGCSTSVEVDVINNKYTPTIEVSEEVCAKETTVIGYMPEEGFTGTWSAVTSKDKITFDSPNASSTVVRGLQLGANTIRWTVLNNNGESCTENYKDVVINNIQPGVAYIKTNEGKETVETCNGKQELKASKLAEGVVGRWFSNREGGFKDGNSTATDVEISGLSKGNNILTWRIYREGHELDCASEDQITVVNNEVDLGKEPADAYTCSGSYTLAAEDPQILNPNGEDKAMGYWRTVSGNATIDNESTNYKINISGITRNSSERFVWTVTKGTCPGVSYEVLINNYGVVPVADTKDGKNTICDSYVDLLAESTSAYGSNVHGYWTLKSYPDTRISDPSVIVIASSTSNEATVTGLSQTGKYSFAWNVYRTVSVDGVDHNFCDTSTIVTVQNKMFTVDADTEVPAGASASTCGSDYKLSAETLNSGVVSQYWETVPKDVVGITFDNSTVSNTTVHGITNDGVTLRWTVDNGACKNSDNITIYNDQYKALAYADAPYTCSGEIKLTTENDLSDNNTHGTWTVEAESGSFSDNLGERITTTTGAKTVKYYNLANGATAKFTWSVSHTANGRECNTSTTFSVTNKRFTVSAGTEAWTDCSDKYTLNANPLSQEAVVIDGVSKYWKGEWSSNTDVTFETSNSTLYPNGVNDPTATVKGLSNATSNKLTWTVTSPYGCKNSAEVVIHNESVDEAKIYAEAKKINICSDTYELSANEPAQGIGTWVYDNGNVSPVSSTAACSNNVVVSGITNNTSATFTWRISRPNGNKGRECYSEDEVTLTNQYYEAKIESPVVAVTNHTWYVIHKLVCVLKIQNRNMEFPDIGSLQVMRLNSKAIFLTMKLLLRICR
jgi:hypothetical protein